MKNKFLIIVSLLALLFFFIFSNNSLKNEENENETTPQTVEIDLFYLTTCPHCHSEMEFLDIIKDKYPQLKVNKYALEERENLELMSEKYKEYDIPKNVWGLVPITLFEDKIYIIGFEDNITDAQIEKNIQQMIEKRKDIDINPIQDNEGKDNTTQINDKRVVNIPLIGQIDVSGFSPLGLAVLFGALDGFNPCAMAALTFLLASLVTSGTRKRVLLIGGTFILVSGIVYFLFIAAWFNLFSALMYIKFITTLIGVFVIFFAITILKEYYSDVICKFCEAEVKKDFISRTQRKFLLKMEEVTRAEVPIALSLISVGLIAVGINMIELFCSMGFPVTFTGMLANFGLSKLSFYLYLAIYIIFYMLDDMIIFLLAVKTLSITQSSQKYIKTIKLISGILLLILGIILMFKPSLLNFA